LIGGYARVDRMMVSPQEGLPESEPRATVTPDLQRGAVMKKKLTLSKGLFALDRACVVV